MSLADLFHRSLVLKCELHLYDLDQSDYCTINNSSTPFGYEVTRSVNKSRGSLYLSLKRLKMKRLMCVGDERETHRDVHETHVQNGSFENCSKSNAIVTENALHMLKRPRRSCCCFGDAEPRPLTLVCRNLKHCWFSTSTNSDSKSWSLYQAPPVTERSGCRLYSMYTFFFEAWAGGVS